ncbi:hypothetical protein ACMDCR_09580 [Labrys okinawensis]|uniref:hypothetical protein n=1 Tax=Labrys okinawensis TaxID=346911 RepID=UPI0039BCAB82
MHGQSMHGQSMHGHLSVSDFEKASPTFELFDNGAFQPPHDARPAFCTFEGVLTVDETMMSTDPETLTVPSAFGKDLRLFPAFEIGFLSTDGELIPANQDLTARPGASYWEVIVQPGKVWSENGDGDWSRGSFPFALVSRIDGNTHNGVATFVYRENAISSLRYQIVQQTAPLSLPDKFLASGALKARYRAAPLGNRDELITEFRKFEKMRLRTRPWSDLAELTGSAKIHDFDSDILPEKLVADALLVGETLYVKSAATPAGELPYAGRQRFGVWSITKTAALGVAILRIAQQFDREIFTKRVSDFVAEARAFPGWVDVTFGDAYTMAAGLGYGSDDPQNGAMEPYDGVYLDWYSAQSWSAKMNHMFRNTNLYSWGPGKVVRYRDEEMFFLALGLDAYVKQQLGPDEDIWSYLTREVYNPLEIQVLPTSRTVEQDLKTGVPYMGYGMYPTLEDLAKIAKLYLNEGEWNGNQLLPRDIVRELLAGKEPRGYRTYWSKFPYYYRTFWYAAHQWRGELTYVPCMSGYGGSVVALLPNGVVALRIANSIDATDDVVKMQSFLDVEL